VGYATTMMKKTGRAMRLDTNHRRSKIVILSKGSSASALTGKVCPDLQKQKPKSLDTADVVRDVAKLFSGNFNNEIRSYVIECSFTADTRIR
jgi:hypothetical protein